MYILTIARRFMWKRPICGVTILIAALVVWIYLLVISVLEGFKNHYMDKIQSVMAHVTVDVGNYAWGIERPHEWAAEIKTAAPGIRAVTLGLETPAMANFDNGRTIGSLRGIDLDQELLHGRLGQILKPPTLTAFGTHAVGGMKLPGCIVGGAWRKSFNLKIGDRITFLFSDEDESARMVAFAIDGFFEGNNSYLESGAYVDRELLAKYIKVEGRAKTMYLWLDDPNRKDLNDVKSRIRDKMAAILKREDPKLVGKEEVETWQEKDNNFYHAVTRENLMMRMIMGLFLALTAFIIFLVFGRMVAEKVRDVGALRAMGASPAGIRACFLMQGFIIGALGVLLGLAAAELTLRNMNWILAAFHLDIYPEDAFAVNQIPHVTLAFDRILITVSTLGSALLGALIPAIHASRLNPVECLRHD